MFTNGDVPKLRFNGFNNRWTPNLIKNVVNRFDNKRVPITESKRIKGTTPYYGANGIQDYIKGYTHNGHFVLIAEDGANSLGDYPIYDVRGKLWINNHAHVINGKDNKVNTDFLAYRLKTIFLYPYLTGNGRYKLNSNVMMSIKINIPSLQEQYKIGRYFRSIDYLIKLDSDKLASLKRDKKAYLQKMLI